MYEYAGVIVDISHENVDRPFEYRIPQRLLGKIEIGMSVTVPFGNGNRLRQGYVIELKEEPEFDRERLKEIVDVAESGVAVDSILIRLAFWMKIHYGSTMINALKTVLPVRRKRKSLEKKEVVRLLSEEETAKLASWCSEKRKPAMARLLQALAEAERLPYGLVKGKLHIAPSTLKSLEKQGVLRLDSVRVYRNPVKITGKAYSGKVLSPRQQEIVDSILKDYDNDVRKTYLLHGITGSGKTEVYINLIAGCIARGKQAVVLIPEIALTYQTVMRFYGRFGDRVSVLHSALSAGEKYDQCERARTGDIDVIIGPRSALFTPFPRLGLIVIDEEHEPSYKSENMPKYHARETAVYLASLHHASVVLGSATPSLESYYRAKRGEYGLFTLSERLTGNFLPEVYPVDLRKELREGNRSVFSRKLQELMEERLEKKEQIMLFLNRRGYAGFVSCRSCGHVMKCPHCDVSLSEHRGGRLVCHYCGYEQEMVRRCPNCGSEYILGFKAGTQQIEEKLHRMYPKARVLRMDSDTTKKKDSYEKILSAFSDGEADILLGTQMIVKGHDFPAVTLVGILAADMSLFAGDYRAAERTFQLLTQAAGRAGRGNMPGEVVIQTYQPEHYSIVHAAAQDYEGFYEEEITYRELAGYPPVAHMLAVLVTGQEEAAAKRLSEQLSELMRGKGERQPGKGFVIGPVAASLAKLSDIYRFVFYIKSASYEYLTEGKDEMEEYLFSLQKRAQQVQFDFDPMNGY